jgi:hypothetical protein
MLILAHWRSQREQPCSLQTPATDTAVRSILLYSKFGFQGTNTSNGFLSSHTTFFWVGSKTGERIKLHNELLKINKPHHTWFCSLSLNSPTRAKVASFFKFLDHTNWHTTAGRLLWTRDRPISETSTLHHATITRTDINTPGGNRTRNPCKREAADPRLKPIGQWHRSSSVIWVMK